PNQRTQSPRPDCIRENLRVRIAMFVHQDSQLLLPGPIRRWILLGVAWTDVAVGLSVEPIDQRVRNVPAIIETNVNDHRLLAHYIFVRLALELRLVDRAHARY